MQINKVSFFNIGNSSFGGEDYFDAIKRGVAILCGKDDYIILKYKNNGKVTSEVIG